MRWKVVTLVLSAVQQRRSKFKPILKSCCPSVQSLTLCTRAHLLQPSFYQDFGSWDFDNLNLWYFHLERRGEREDEGLASMR